MKAFSKFENTSEALEAATLLIDGKASKGLRKFLRVHCENETLGVADKVAEHLACTPKSQGKHPHSFQSQKMTHLNLGAAGLQ